LLLEIQVKGLDMFGNMFCPPNVPNVNVLPRIEIKPVVDSGVAGAVLDSEETREEQRPPQERRN